MKIKYQFATETVEIEVSDDWGNLVIDLDRQEYNNDHKENRRHVSLDAAEFEIKKVAVAADGTPVLEDFAEAALAVKVLSTDAKGKKTVALTNTTSFPYLLRFGNANPVILNPFCTHRTTVGKDADLKFTVENMWCSEKGHPQVEIEVK